MTDGQPSNLNDTVTAVRRSGPADTEAGGLSGSLLRPHVRPSKCDARLEGEPPTEFDAADAPVYCARKRRRSSVVLLTSVSPSSARNPGSASLRDPLAMRFLAAPSVIPSRAAGGGEREPEGPSHRDAHWQAQAASGTGAHVDSEIAMSQPEAVPPGAPARGNSRWDLDSDLDAGGASGGNDRLGRLVLEAQALVADFESNLDKPATATASGTASGSDGGQVNVTLAGTGTRTDFESDSQPDSDAKLPLPSQVDKSHHHDRLAGGDHQLPPSLALTGRRRHLCSLCPYQAKSRWEVSA